MKTILARRTPLATKTLALALLTSLAFVKPVQAQNIDTTPSWNHHTGLFSWGEPQGSTYGQVFTATDQDQCLESFTFFLEQDNGASSNIPYRAFVYAWDGTKPTGPALFKSKLRSTGVLPSNSYTHITVNPGMIKLTTGQQYVCFFSTAGVQDGKNLHAGFGVLVQNGNPVDAYNGGNWVTQNGMKLSDVLATPWFQPGSQGQGQDFAFRATFCKNTMGAHPPQDAADTPEAGDDAGTP